MCRYTTLWNVNALKNTLCAETTSGEVRRGKLSSGSGGFWSPVSGVVRPRVGTVTRGEADCDRRRAPCEHNSHQEKVVAVEKEQRWTLVLADVDGRSSQGIVRKYVFTFIWKYEGHPINKLLNGVVLLIFKIWKIRDIRLTISRMIPFSNLFMGWPS